MSKKIKYFIFIVFIGALSGIICARISLPRDAHLFALRQMIPARKKAFLSFELPAADRYLIKVKLPAEGIDKEIFLNNKRLRINQIRERGKTESDYLFVPLEFTHRGQNFLRINFLRGLNQNIDIRINNFRRKVGNAVIAFPDSNLAKDAQKRNLFAAGVWGILLFTGLWFLLLFLWQRILLNLERIYLYSALIFLSWFIFLILLWLIPQFLNWVLLLPLSFLINLGVAWLFFSVIILIFKLGYRGFKSKEDIFKPQTKTLLNKGVEWFIKQEFSNKCVLAFMVSLIGCAFLLILHLEPIAEQLANFAYFALVTGVVIKFVKLVREKEDQK